MTFGLIFASALPQPLNTMVNETVLEEEGGSAPSLHVLVALLVADDQEHHGPRVQGAVPVRRGARVSAQACPDSAGTGGSHLLTLINQSTNQPTHQPITHSLTHSLTYSLIHQSINQSITHSLTQSVNQSFIHVFTHSLTHSLTQSIHQLFIHLFTYSSTQRFIHLLVNSFIRSFIRSPWSQNVCPGGS